MPDFIAPITTCSLVSGWYFTEQDVTLTANEAADIFYILNGGLQQTYSGPIHIDVDSTLTFWSIDPWDNLEVTQTRDYVIDLDPYVITPVPRAGTYRSVALHFNTSKAGVINYRTNGGAWQVYSATINITSTQVVEYQGVSDGRTYPIVALGYTIDPEADSVNIFPTPLATYRTPTFQITLDRADTFNTDTIIYRINNGPWINYTVPFTAHHYEKVEAALRYVDTTLSDINEVHYNVIDTSDQWLIMG
jgi:hypothetical protein